MEQMNHTQSGPWCLIGDFNNILQAQDRIGGTLVGENEYKDLQNMMEKTNLHEMDTGVIFTLGLINIVPRPFILALIAFLLILTSYRGLVI